MMHSTKILDSAAIQTSEGVFHAKSWGMNWGDELIEELMVAAMNTSRHRSRLCLHPDINDPHQEMLIVMNKLAIERPQKRTIGFDTKMVIAGEAKLHYYDDKGNVLRTTNLGKNFSIYSHTCSDEYHALEICSEWFVFLEILKGPFTSTTTEFANFQNISASSQNKI